MGRIRLLDKYKPLFSNDTRLFILTGGRGSFKSFHVATFATLLTFELGHKILYTRYTMKSAHISIIPEFTEKIGLMEVANFFQVNKQDIKNTATNSEIYFRGIKTSSGDQTANLKSLQGVTTWIMDEAEELVDEKTFDDISLSIRQQGQQNRIILILNPASKEHWIYKRFFEAAGVEPGSNTVKNGVTYIHTTYQDAPELLHPDFVADVELMKHNNPHKYKHKILGGWLDKLDGVVFNNWVIGEFVPSDYTYFGQDYGFTVDPTTLVEVAIHKSKKEVYVKQHLYKRGMDTTEIHTNNVRYAGNRLIIADSAEPRLIAELRARGENIKGIDKPKVIERIRLLQDFKIVVDPDSTDVIKELNNYVWSDRKSDTPIDDYNHALDAIGYVMWHVLSNPTSGQYSFNRLRR